VAQTTTASSRPVDGRAHEALLAENAALKAQLAAGTRAKRRRTE